MKSRHNILLVALFVALSSPAFAQSAFYLHTNDRVIFYGDSITEQYRYGAFIESYVLTRFPGLNVRFINAGWSGDWVVGGGGGKVDERLARDVVAQKAAVATFMVGMNDAGYQDFDQAFFDVYTKGYQHLIDRVRKDLPALRITLLQPSPFDDVTRAPQYALHDGGYNKVLIRYGDFLREFGRQQNVEVVDMNAPLLTVLEKARLDDQYRAEKIIPDRIHPGRAGGLVMAAAILNAWNAPPVVSAVEIDASHGRVRRSENTAVTELQKAPTISWTQHDNALPLPLDPKDEVLSLVLRSSTIVESLDQQLLKVTGLPSPRYVLSIDGGAVGNWAREELENGINLALVDTPMLQQALGVHALTERRNAVRLARWQGVQVALRVETSPRVTDALTALDALDDELVQQQQNAAVTKSHHFELVPQKDPSSPDAPTIHPVN